MDPLLPPKQLILLIILEDALNAVGWLMVWVVVAVQLLASLTVRVYAPAVRPVMLAVVNALLQV